MAIIVRMRARTHRNVRSPYGQQARDLRRDGLCEFSRELRRSFSESISDDEDESDLKKRIVMFVVRSTEEITGFVGEMLLDAEENREGKFRHLSRSVKRC